MQIQIITNGKIKEQQYLAAISEYQKRLSAFTKVRLLSVSEYEPDPREYVFSFVSHGETISSETLAAKLQDHMLKGCSSITFLPASYETGADRLCISNIQLSEALTACVLHEQIYRAFMIINNRTYHK